jgi:hypothetical protein
MTPERTACSSVAIFISRSSIDLAEVVSPLWAMRVCTMGRVWGGHDEAWCDGECARVVKEVVWWVVRVQCGAAERFFFCPTTKNNGRGRTATTAVERTVWAWVCRAHWHMHAQGRAREGTRRGTSATEPGCQSECGSGRGSEGGFCEVGRWQ